MSLYGDYIKEREDKEIFENEKGFIVFRVCRDDNGDRYMFIDDLYVVPKWRRKYAATELSAHVDELAKEYGINSVFCAVNLAATGCTESLRAILANGYRLSKIDQTKNLIFLMKNI